MNNISQQIIKEAKFKKLNKLDLSNSELSVFPKDILDMQYLELLNLNNNRLVSLPDEVSQLENLRFFHLAQNQFENVPDCITKLKKLTLLDFGTNKLSTLPNNMSNLEMLQILLLGNNQFSNIPDAIFSLRNLIKLDFSQNQLESISMGLLRLQKLEELGLWANKFSNLPEAIYDMLNLRKLYMESNSISTISPGLLRLKNLNVFTIENNPIESPPPEVISKGLIAIQGYLQQLISEGQDYVFEAKLLIVGEGGAGKTTLANKIIQPDFELSFQEPTTEGIEISQWEFFLAQNHPGLQKLIGSDKRFRVNIWDFGGQEIYHATHQFFLTKRSLYALIADTRKEDTDFFYWLNIIELLSDNSPVIIVKNEKQDRHREINERLLRGRFTNLEKTLSTNLATNRGLDEIVKTVKYYITNLSHVGTVLPKTWVKVREALESDMREYISFEEYIDICRRNGFIQIKDILQLIGYLHDLGVCLYFQDDPLLKKFIILKPQWGTDAVYKVLDNKTVIRNLGFFTTEDLDKIWVEDRYVSMRDELLQLMMKFQLCYAIPGKDKVYIAPQLLTENQPEYNWHKQNNLVVRYKYEFMPKGILTRFIVAMQHLIVSQKYVWRSGIILKLNDSGAEVVEFYVSREIKIRVAGKTKKELMTIIIYELDKIHESFNRLKYDKLIPCNCTMCQQVLEPHYFAFDVLKRFVADGQQQIQCQLSYEMVDVRKLVDDVIGSHHFVSKNSDSETVDFPMLIQKIKQHFSYDEFITLCYQLDVPFDDLVGETLTLKIQSLIDYVRRRGDLQKLIEILASNRPHVTWI